jgi:AGCS family alanine or glycine:cation symporter
MIVRSAIDPQSVFGGVVGIGIMQAVRFGVARGILSNESGLGSAPIAHAAAKTKDPVTQGQIAMMGTFIDTLVVCTLTALVITVTGAYRMGPLFAENPDTALRGIDMTMFAFNQVIPGGNAVVMIGSFLFGFSTLLGWSYYGEKCTEYLFGSKVKVPYRLLFIGFLFIGSLPTAEGISAVVAVGDIGNALMAVPNLIALIFLAREVGKITKDYIRNKKNLANGAG